ncbi:MAG TPA: DUF1549 domain-containing protein [Vicinamibacterales bacterium]
MSKLMRLASTGSAVVLWGAAMLASSPRAGMPQASPAGRIDFETAVRPILAKNCLECHDQQKRKGGLSLASYGDLLDGGKDGSIVRPGNGAGSLLIRRLLGQVDEQMPKDADPLAAAQIAVVQRWIDEGARLTPSAAPAPPPWEAPLELAPPAVPAVSPPGWTSPIDRLAAAYFQDHGVVAPPPVSDAQFARRVYLDVWGLLPPPDALAAFVADTSPAKREALVARLLADNDLYADHWMSFWNDLLRNEDGYSYFSEQNGRKSITTWLRGALRSNLPYDRFVRDLLDPPADGGPEGFLIGVNWRGETSAAVTPWMQASQNTAQVFLGINLKCNSCHNSFISQWKLKDAYGLAAYFSPTPSLQLYRCDVAQNQFAEPAFLYPQLARAPASASLADRRAAAAATFTDPRNGRLARTLVNRLWQRLLGRGLVLNVDEMDGRPWSPELLDWLAADFVDHGYDVKHLIATILGSRPYQLPAVSRPVDAPAVGFVFTGPELRRLSAEQFADAIGEITGEWSLLAGGGGDGKGTASDSPTSGTYVREYRASSTQLTRALGRPIRDQVTSVRATDFTTLQALELVNGELLTRWLMRGARRMTGQLPPEPRSRFTGTTGGRYASARAFDADVSGAATLWLVVADTGSNAPERVLPEFVDAEFVGSDGTTVPLAALTPVDGSGLRAGGPVRSGRVAVKNGSRLIYNIAGRGLTRFRGNFGLENDRAEIGSTLNPSVRFFVFDAEPNMQRLLPPASGTPLPAPPPVTTIRAVVDRIFHAALGRAPSPQERGAAEAAIADPTRPAVPSADAVADLLWAVLMTPEFQLIF